MIRIRPYMDSDEEKILPWCADEETFYRWTAGVLGKYPMTRTQFQKTGDLMRFTALDEKETVGFFTVRNPVDALNELRFGFVIVDPNRRRNGIGRRMLALGLTFAFEIYQAKRVTLGVLENNVPAYACYRAVGFSETGSRETYRICGREQNAIEMEFVNPR